MNRGFTQDFLIRNKRHICVKQFHNETEYNLDINVLTFWEGWLLICVKLYPCFIQIFVFLKILKENRQSLVCIKCIEHFIICFRNLQLVALKFVTWYYETCNYVIRTQFSCFNVTSYNFQRNKLQVFKIYYKVHDAPRACNPKKYEILENKCTSWAFGLVAWFSLRVREVPSSILGMPQILFLLFFQNNWAFLFEPNINKFGLFFLFSKIIGHFFWTKYQ